MTTEEMERAIEFLLDHHAKFSTDVDKTRETVDKVAAMIGDLVGVVTHHDEQIDGLVRQGKETGAQIDRLVAQGIDLQRQVKETTESVKAQSEQIAELRESVKQTTDNLNALIQHVSNHP